MHYIFLCFMLKCIFFELINDQIHLCNIKNKLIQIIINNNTQFNNLAYPGNYTTIKTWQW